MSRKPLRHPRHENQQRGYAMIIMLTVFALMSSYFIASGMSRTQAEINIERDKQTLQALQAAKAALIAYVGAQVSGTDGANDQPGALPCPSTDEAGQAASTCSVPTNYAPVGRFPWKTIGTETLRDGSGLVLWYALSSNFRKASGTTVINGDTQGTLTVTGSTSASNVVALIIAPGNALNGQDRSSNTILNYLESASASTTATDTASESFSTAQSSETFNDRLVIVTQADLMAVVEPLVAARIERDVKPYITEYYSVDSSNLGWSAYPFAATFANPTPGTSGSGTTRAQSTYVGTAGLSIGLLPITSSASYSWTSGSGTVTLQTPTKAGSISGTTCVTSSTSWRCTFTVNALNSVAICGSTTRYCIVTPTIRISGQIGTNAGKSFADLPSASTVTVTVRSGSDAGCTTTLNTRAISGTLTSSGLGTVNFDATPSTNIRKSSSFVCNMRITIPVVVANPVTSSSDATSGWFIKNEWYRQTYYAVSSGYLPGGGSSCSAGSTCLTVDNLPSTYTTANDKRAIMIFAGRVLTGSRPSSNLAYYLEGTNLSTAQSSPLPSPLVFSHQNGSVATFNDRAIVIAP